MCQCAQNALIKNNRDLDLLRASPQLARLLDGDSTGDAQPVAAFAKVVSFMEVRALVKWSYCN